MLYKEIRVTWKIRVLPSENLPQTLDLENFAMASRLVWSTKLVDGRACVLHLWGRARRGRTHTVHTFVDCNPLTPLGLFRFLLDLSYKLSLHCLQQLAKFDWHIALRGPSAVEELLVECSYLTRRLLFCMKFWSCNLPSFAGRGKLQRNYMTRALVVGRNGVYYVYYRDY